MHHPTKGGGGEGGVTEGETGGGRARGDSGIRLLQGREMSCEVKVEM